MSNPFSTQERLSYPENKLLSPGERQTIIEHWASRDARRSPGPHVEQGLKTPIPAGSKFANRLLAEYQAQPQLPASPVAAARKAPRSRQKGAAGKSRAGAAELQMSGLATAEQGYLSEPNNQSFLPSIDNAQALKARLSNAKQGGNNLYRHLQQNARHILGASSLRTKSTHEEQQLRGTSAMFTLHNQGLIQPAQMQNMINQHLKGSPTLYKSGKDR